MVTEEELRNMSPEQILELQKQQCIFCKMVSGEIPTKKVFENDDFVAVLDINPAILGHVLVLPKQHVNIMPQMPEDLVGKLGMVSKLISQALLKGLKANGTTVFIANGAVAGQRAPHFLMHIIPRFDNDNVGMTIPDGAITEQELEEIQKKIQPIINSLLGVKQEVVLEEASEEEKEILETDEEAQEESSEEKEETVKVPVREDENDEDFEELEEVQEEVGVEEHEEESEEDSEDEEDDNDEDEEESDEEIEETEEEHDKDEKEYEELSKKEDLDSIADFLTGGGQ
jgi:histidine triad (HIT) family protein